MSKSKSHTICVRSRKTDSEEHSVTSAAPQATFFLDGQIEIELIHKGTHIEVRRKGVVNSPHIGIDPGPGTSLVIRPV